MIARAVAVSNAKSSNSHNNSNFQKQESIVQGDRSKEIMISDRDIFRSFWDGVFTSTVIQKDKVVPSKSKNQAFRKSLNESIVEQLFADHSKEVSTCSLFLSFFLIVCPLLYVSQLIQHKGLFDNEAPFKMIWDILMGALILFSVVIVPFRIGFQVTPSHAENHFDSAVDLLFSFDIIFSFNTAYVDPITEVVVTDRKKIAMNYFKLWFWIDLASTVPFDTIVTLFVGGGGGGLAALRLIKILRLTRMLKLLRVLKLSKVGKLIESYNINPALIGIQKLLLQICFMAHLVSCFWHFLTTSDATPNFTPDTYSDPHPNPDGDNWVEKFGFATDPISAQYVASFYWTISTMLTIGYGDISGTNSTERLFCIFTMLLGGVMFGAVIAQVTKLIESRNPQARAFKEKMDEVKAYLNEKVLPIKLKFSIKEAYAFFLTKKSSFGETGIFEELPPNLLNRLVVSIYSTEVHRINLFKICDENFVVKLVISAKPFQALPGMKIVEKGDVADEIIFVMRGIVQFTTIGYTELDGAVDAITGWSTEGNYFGDFEYYKRTIRMVTHRAMCNCNLMSVSTALLDEALQNYPLTGDKINLEFDERYRNFLAASQSEAHKKDGFRVYIKNLLVVDGQIQNHSDGETSQLYGKKINSSNAVLEVYRTVTFVKHTEGKIEEIHAEEHMDDLLNRYILLPRSQNKILWDLFIGVLIMYSVIVIPVEIGFQVIPSGGLAHFDSAVDILFGLDMILTLRTCYYEDSLDAYVVSSWGIVSNYFKTWFVIDFCSVFPFELLLAGTTSASVFRSLKLIKVIRLLRLLKLARLAKLRQYFAKLEDSLGINPATFELLKMLLEVVFIGHLVCCLYWGLSWNISDYAWFDKLDLRDAPLQARYITTLYWTFTTLSTVGYGDITPVDTQGRLVTICVMIMGGTVFGYIVANVSSLMASLDVTATRMNDRIAEVSEYLMEKNASVPLSESILKHVKYMFTQSSAFDERAIMSRLPMHLCRKMILLQHSETISKITIFQHIENKGVVVYLFRLLTPIFYDSLQYISTEGTLAHEIVFLVSGKANVYKTKLKYQQHKMKQRPTAGIHHAGQHQIRSFTSSTPSTTPIEHCDLISQLGPGDFFGHMSMMLKRPYQASVRTFMPCSIYTLSQLEITKLLRTFPAVAITLQGALALAINQTNSHSRHLHRLRRAEFLNSLGSLYVAARAQHALKVKEIEKTKSSKDVLTNLIRMNTTESEKGASNAGGNKRRSSIAIMFGRSKSSPVYGGAISEFTELPREDMLQPSVSARLAPDSIASALNDNDHDSDSKSQGDDKSSKYQLNSDCKEGSMKFDPEPSPHSPLKPLLIKSESDEHDTGVKFLNDLPVLQPKNILPPISSMKSPIKKNAIVPLEAVSNGSDSDNEENALAIHDSFNEPPVKLKPSLSHVITKVQKQIEFDPTTFPANDDDQEKSLRKKNSKWNLVRAVVHDPAAMAIVQQQLEATAPPSDQEGFTTQHSNSNLIQPSHSNLMNSIAHKGMELIGRNNSLKGPLAIPPPKQQIARRSSSIAAVVRASIANKKRQRVMLLLSGNELYDSDEDKKENNVFYLIKSRALNKRHRSCPNFSEVSYHVQHQKASLNGLKRRVSFPSFDYDQQNKCLENHFLL